MTIGSGKFYLPTPAGKAKRSQTEVPVKVALVRLPTWPLPATFHRVATCSVV